MECQKKKSFQKTVLKKLDEEESLIMLSVGENWCDEGVNSLFMTIMKKDDRFCHILNICGQEEDECCHSVIQSGHNEYAIYDYVNDVLIQDVYLHDKYNDCTDCYFSNFLSVIFKNIPKVEKKFEEINL